MLSYHYEVDGHSRKTACPDDLNWYRLVMTTTETGGRFYRQRLLVYSIPRIECASCMACIQTSAKSLQSRFGVEGALPHRHITSLAVVQRCVVVSPHVPSSWASLHSWTSATPFLGFLINSQRYLPNPGPFPPVLGACALWLACYVTNPTLLSTKRRKRWSRCSSHLCRSRFRFVFQSFRERVLM